MPLKFSREEMDLLLEVAKPIELSQHEMAAKKIDRRLAAAAIAAVAVYLGLAYVLAPFFWRHFEHQPKLAGFEATTRTALGLPGDAINVGLEGSEDDVLCAMHAAGWRPADPVTLSSSVRIVGSVLLDRPYLDAPVSPLFYQNRKQDLAFEKPSGKSARTRHHVRFWEGARRRRRRPASLARRGRLRQRPRRQPLHRASHPPHGARHRRGARFFDVRPRAGEEG
jgi:hypothetical protein